MHLSLLSDSFVSDSLADDSAPISARSFGSDADLHFKGLVRGVLFACALALPLLLTVGAAWLNHADGWGSQSQAMEGGQTNSD